MVDRPDDALVVEEADARDRDGRQRAVDPRFNVALEASAGTGKTSVLVARYVNLLRANVDPANVLAMTFTRKAAGEMRERIVSTLRDAAERGEISPARWRTLRDRVSDIAVSTIDAFCLSLLREFPLEAGLDPGFALADETEVPRLIDESLDRALRICRGLGRSDEDIALVFAQLGDRRARRGLAALLNRRLVAPDVLSRFLARGPLDLTVDVVVDRAARALLQAFEGMRGGLDGFVATGPVHAGFHLLARSLDEMRSTIDAQGALDHGATRATLDRVREHFLTKDGQPRRRQLLHPRAMFPSDAAWRIHRAIVVEHAADILRITQAFARDLNVLVARGVWRMYRVADAEYRRTRDANVVLDFPDLLLRTIDLLRQMDEFARSRFRLESRYHHVLVDEFQDTSRPQWELVALLVQAWGAGVGAAFEGPLPPSIFVVGDRKQSIYGFRDADVSLLHEAAKYLDGLRPDGNVRRSISRSFRSVPAILSFVNDVCRDIVKTGERPDAFRYDDQDRFPLDPVSPLDAEALGVITGDSAEGCAAATAAEIAHVLSSEVVVRDRDTGVRRTVKPSDIAILFRARESHRVFEDALERLAIPSHVHKGLGFFDTEEIADVRALLWYLADPASDLRAAALLRSRFIRLSDDALRVLAPRLAAALGGDAAPPERDRLDADDLATLDAARRDCARWRAFTDQVPPAELLDRVLRESGYMVETRGPRFFQARENLKKVRSLVRRLQNRGYATLARVALHLEYLATGDDANAPIEARNAVSLMTVHASKGLEFPVVFVVDLTRGAAGRRDPIRVFADPARDAVSVSVGDFMSEDDEDMTIREREETKRLLYVAMTRARDRLYLGAVVTDGRLQVGRGSLAEVLPASLLAVLASPAPLPGMRWTASSGVAHRLARRGLHAVVRAPVQVAPIPDAIERAVDHAPLLGSRAAHATPSSVQASFVGEEVLRRSSGRLVGVAVHRLFERHGCVAWSDPAARLRAARAVIRAEEWLDVEEPDAFVELVVEMHEAVCAHPDVRSLYVAGRRHSELPFSMRVDGVLVRGIIDGLIETDDGRVVVLEFKTGQPRAEHQAQLALYREAASRLFPDSPVEARLVYVEKTQGTMNFPGK